MNIYSQLSLFAFIFYIYLALYIFSLDRKSRLHRTFLALYLCWAVWAFGYIFLYISGTKEEVWMWFRVSAVGWTFAPAILIHFTLILTQNYDSIKKKVILPVFYIMSVILFARALFSTVTVKDFIFINSNWFPVEALESPWYWINVSFYLIAESFSIFLILKWGKRSKRKKQKWQAAIFVVSSIASIVLGFLSNLILPAMKIYAMPSATHIFAMIWASGILYAVIKYKMMTVTAEIAVNEIMSKMMSMLVLTDYEGKIIKTNIRIEDFLGYSESELVGKSADILTNDKEIILSKIEEARKIKNDKEIIKSSFEVNLLAKSGEIIPVKTSISKITDTEEDVAGFVIVAHDIRQMRQLKKEIIEKNMIEEELRKSQLELEIKVAERTKELKETNRKLQDEINERMRIEEDLLKSEEKYRLITQSANDGIFMLDGEGDFTFLNPKVTRISGYSEEDLQGKNFAEVVDKDYIELTKENFMKAAKGQEKKVLEIEIVSKYKEKIPIEISTSSIFGKDGTFEGLIGIIRDITERKRAENTIRDMMIKLSELNMKLEQKVEETVAELREKDKIMIVQSRLAAMGEMIGNIAHQWRQPITAISLMLQDLEEEYKEGTLTIEYFDAQVKEVTKTIRFMSNTINDFRDFFKPDKEKEEFSIRSIVNRAVAIVSASFKNNVKIEMECSEEIFAEGFPNEYAQVVLNILNNAKDVFAEKKLKNPAIGIKIYRENEKAVLIIRDNGGGIPDSIKEEIFKPYFTTKGESNGTGIGLYMSKNIIEKNMGGSLSFRNYEGGAEFRIEI